MYIIVNILCFQIAMSGSVTGSAPADSAPNGSGPVGSAPVDSAPAGLAPLGFAPVGSAQAGSAPAPAPVCLLVLVGVPATGKSTFSAKLKPRVQQSGTRVVHVCYDQLVPLGKPELN